MADNFHFIVITLAGVIMKLTLASYNGTSVHSLHTSQSSSHSSGHCKNSFELCPSKFDKRQYHFTNLPTNGLRVLIVSDPKTTTSVASMTVAAGSFHDPPSHQGLAHLCEKMIPLGTKKYPDITAYSNFIHTYGGSYYSITRNEETTFNFNISSQFLYMALDMFGQFFIRPPQFNPSYLYSVVSNIHEKHLSELLNGENKINQLLKHISNRNHSFHQFGTGNYNTLSKRDTREKLIDFYHRFYSANAVSTTYYSGVNVIGECASTLYLKLITPFSLV